MPGTDAKNKPCFNISRSSFLLEPARESNTKSPINLEKNSMNCNVLVINSSHLMAKEITLQLTLNMPGCSIMYAPTIELGGHILARRKVSLIVSSPVLPDGGIEKLREKLLTLESPPDLVVVHTCEKLNLDDIRSRTRFQVAALTELDGNIPPIVPKSEGKSIPPNKSNSTSLSSIGSLGADIRNDLNNPLQEIVAMVYVAKANREVAEGTLQALQAIDLAAKNMANYVNCLEDKIRGVMVSD